MDNGFYLYAIGRSRIIDDAKVRAAVEHMTGVDETFRLETFKTDSLCAFYSKVSLAEFGHDEIKKKIQDVVWLEKKARAHDGIVKQLSSFATVVPVRFSTVFLSLESLQTSVKENASQLSKLLDELEGFDEIGVTINFDKQQVSKYLERTDPSLEKLSKGLQESGAGAAYMMQKKFEMTKQERLGSFITECVSSASNKLRKGAREVKQSGLLARPDDRTKVYVNLACLVPVDELEEFTLQAMELPKLPTDAGISIRVTGPWPPYSFASFDAGYGAPGAPR